MALPLYLAQTRWEMTKNPPERMAYLACHFSPGGTGLSNLPDCLPSGAILILDDSNPMCGHDPELVGTQLSELIQRYEAEALLLDFQHPGIGQQQELAKLLSDLLPCPVGVSEIYAQGLPCPVFLPPVPPDCPLSAYLAPWQGRELWLETALDGIRLTLTESGCTAQPLWDFPEGGLADNSLHCHYTIDTSTASATFRLWRTREDLYALFSDAEHQGVTKAIGLWQELK